MGVCESCGAEGVVTQPLGVGTRRLQVCPKCYATISAEMARMAAARAKEVYYEAKRKRLHE